MKKILSVSAVILLGIFGFLIYSGLFASIQIQEKDMGPFILVYENHTGSYSKIGEVETRVYYNLLDKEKITTTKGFGIYYDNPRAVSKDKLRSIGGVILETGDAAKLPDLLSKNYNIKTINKSKAIVVDIPFKNMVSIYLGAMRVYPQISKYITEKKYPMKEMMEIYDFNNKKITYLMFL